MLIGVQFKTFNKDGEEYSSRFGFFNDIRSAKKAAINLYQSDDNIFHVEAYDSETGKLIKRVPDGRGGWRGGGRTAFDNEPRPYKLTIRVAEDVWQALSQAEDKSALIHRAVRQYTKTNQ